MCVCVCVCVWTESKPSTTLVSRSQPVLCRHVHISHANATAENGLAMHSYRYTASTDICITIPDLCTEAGTSVNGGQSVLNPWYIIGGVASAVCTKDEFIM